MVGLLPRLSCGMATDNVVGFADCLLLDLLQNPFGVIAGDEWDVARASRP
jgi:hypothetical protein